MGLLNEVVNIELCLNIVVLIFSLLSPYEEVKVYSILVVCSVWCSNGVLVFCFDFSWVSSNVEVVVWIYPVLSLIEFFSSLVSGIIENSARFMDLVIDEL